MSFFHTPRLFKHVFLSYQPQIDVTLFIKYQGKALREDKHNKGFIFKGLTNNRDWGGGGGGNA